MKGAKTLHKDFSIEAHLEALLKNIINRRIRCHLLASHNISIRESRFVALNLFKKPHKTFPHTIIVAWHNWSVKNRSKKQLTENDDFGKKFRYGSTMAKKRFKFSLSELSFKFEFIRGMKASSQQQTLLALRESCVVYETFVPHFLRPTFAI